METITDAIPVEVLIESLPECGVLIKMSETPGEEFALYWTFSPSSTYITTRLAVGDLVDLTNESIYF